LRSVQQGIFDVRAAAAFPCARGLDFLPNALRPSAPVRLLALSLVRSSPSEGHVSSRSRVERQSAGLQQRGAWSCAAVFVASAAPSAALAGAAVDAGFCVDAGGAEPTNSCAGFPCLVSHPSFDSALAAAAALPDLTDGTRPHVVICLVSDEAHFESLDVDNRGDAVGDPLELEFGDTPLCPGVGAAAGEPVVSFETGDGDSVFGLNIDLRDAGVCGGNADGHPGLLLGGPGSFGFYGTISGAHGYSIGNGLDADPASLVVGQAALTDCLGPAIWTREYASLASLEVSNCRVDASTGGGALIWDELNRGISLGGGVIFGNLVDGNSGGAQALIRGQLFGLDRMAIVANAAAGGIPFVETGYGVTPYSVGEDGVPEGQPRGISGSVFSRNRQVSSTEGFVMPPATVSAFGEASAGACAGLALNAPLEFRPSPYEGLPTGDGPLLRLLPELGADGDGEFAVRHSFFTGNELGGGSLIEADTGAANTLVHILQNTFADNGAARVLDVQDAFVDSGAWVLRNLWAPGDATLPAPAPGDALVRLGGFPGRVVVSMNVAAEGVAWLDPAAQPSGASVTGPQVSVLEDVFVEGAFLPAAEVRGAEPPARAALVCPGADPAYWTQLAGQGQRFPCAVDDAAAWIPAPGFVASLGEPWPWATSFFESSSGGAWEAPGATGWDCSVARSTLDRIVDNGDWGDGDGFPDALDCDNEDPSVVPALPPWDGYAAPPFCEDAGFDCYECPAGSETPPPGDDDSAADDDSGSGDDEDDDSGSPADDDDSALGSDDDGEPPGRSFLIREGCHRGSGCGFAWSCEGGGGAGDAGSALSAALLPLAALSGRRRRRNSAP
jgi:hypothetical protein